MGFDWQAFTETDTSFSARITIRQTGQIGFTSGAINLYEVMDYDNVVLYFDARQRAVGVKLTNEAKPGAIPIKKSKSNTYIRGKNFCDRYGIDYSKAYRYDLKEDKANDMLFFLLDDGEEGAGEKQDSAEDGQIDQF